MQDSSEIPKEPMLAEKDVAVAMGVHPRTLQQHRLAGTPMVAYCRVGTRRIWYRREDVVRALNEMRVPSVRETTATAADAGGAQ